MKVSKVAVVGVSVLMVLVLWKLPRVVVENETASLGEKMDKDSTKTQPVGMQDANDQQHSEISAKQQSLIDNLKTAISQSPTETEAVPLLDSLVNVWKQVNKYDSAGFYAEAFAKTYPKEVLHKVKAGDLYYEAFTFAIAKEKEKAMAANAKRMYELALGQNPKLNDLKVKIGMTLVSTETPMQGILMIREVLKTDPNNRLALFNLGVLAMQSTQYDKALERFKALKNLDSTDIQARFYLGVAHSELKQFDLAKKEFNYIKTNEKNQDILASVDNYMKKMP
jgi:outer membrane protein